MCMEISSSGQIPADDMPTCGNKQYKDSNPYFPQDNNEPFFNGERNGFIYTIGDGISNETNGCSEYDINNTDDRPFDLLLISQNLRLSMEEDPITREIYNKADSELSADDLEYKKYIQDMIDLEISVYCSLVRDGEFSRFMTRMRGAICAQGSNVREFLNAIQCPNTIAGLVPGSLYMARLFKTTDVDDQFIGFFNDPRNRVDYNHKFQVYNQANDNYDNISIIELLERLPSSEREANSSLGRIRNAVDRANQAVIDGDAARERSTKNETDNISRVVLR